MPSIEKPGLLAHQWVGEKDHPGHVALETVLAEFASQQPGGKMLVLSDPQAFVAVCVVASRVGLRPRHLDRRGSIFSDDAAIPTPRVVRLVVGSVLDDR